MINNIKNIIFNNILLKIVSIIFAVIVFFVIHISLNETVIKTVKVTPSLKIPTDSLLTSKLPEISIILKASKTIIENISNKRLSLTLEADRSNQFVITKKLFPELKDIEVIQILPERVSVVVEKVIEKKVPIVLNTINQLPKGYIYKKTPALKLKEVTIKGPLSYVSVIDKIYTEPLNQNKIVNTTFKLLNLKVDKFIQVNEPKPIKVEFKIEEQIVKKEFKGLKIIFINCEMKKYGIEPMRDKIDLFVEYPYSLDRKLQTKDFYVYADLKGCNKFKSITDLQLITTSFYNNVEIKYASPDTIIVKKKIYHKNVE